MGIKNNLIGLFLLPFTLGFAAAFMEVITDPRILDISTVLFIAGFAAYTLIHLFLYRPRFPLTFAHEITHVLWGLAFLARVKEVRIGRDHGFVRLSKTNAAINLAPYFFPFFTALVAVASIYVRAEYRLHIIFLLGFSLSLHLFGALETLRAGQTDISRTGALFSLPLIFITNLIVIVLILNIVSPEKIMVSRFLTGSVQRTYLLVEPLLGG